MKTKLLSIVNAILLWATLVVNYLATSLPIAGRTTWELSDMYPNLFVPAWFTFSIWGLIYLLLIAFVVWQLIDAFSKKSVWIAKHIGPWFLLSCIANMWRIFAWHHTKIWLSVVIMFGILASLIMMSTKLKTLDPKKKSSRKEKLFVHAPFWVYLGWISVATIANISTYLVDFGRNMFGMTEIFWTIVVIFAATFLGILAVYKDSNIPYALVVLRAFYGIFYKRMAIDPFVTSSILSTLWICSIVLSGAVGLRLRSWFEK